MTTQTLQQGRWTVPWSTLTSYTFLLLLYMKR
jgi:hypothetical protein